MSVNVSEMSVYSSSYPQQESYNAGMNPYGSDDTEQNFALPEIDNPLLTHATQRIAADMDFIPDPKTGVQVVTTAYQKTDPTKRFIRKTRNDAALQAYDMCFRIINPHLDNLRAQTRNQSVAHPLAQQMLSNKVTACYNGLTLIEAIKNTSFVGTAQYLNNGIGSHNIGVSLIAQGIVPIAIGQGIPDMHAGATVGMRPMMTKPSSTGDLVDIGVGGGQCPTKVRATLMEVHPQYYVAHRLNAACYPRVHSRLVGICSNDDSDAAQCSPHNFFTKEQDDNQIAPINDAGHFTLDLISNLKTVMGTECMALVDSVGFQNDHAYLQHSMHNLAWANANLKFEELDNLNVTYTDNSGLTRKIHPDWVKRLIIKGFADTQTSRQLSMWTNQGENIQNYTERVNSLIPKDMDFMDAKEPLSFVPSSGRVIYSFNDERKDLDHPNWMLQASEWEYHRITFLRENGLDMDEHVKNGVIGRVVSNGCAGKSADVLLS